MARRVGEAVATLVVEGLYERIRSNELRTALSPDPRLTMMITDLVPRCGKPHPAGDSPCTLNQTEALLAKEP
jgi:hypothetical protein